ncbi:hypothetical protein Tco_0175447, partial [Tanacetum coccineum]
HAEGRKNGARMSGGHFIGRLADHFGLVSDKGLMGLSVITRMLLVFDLHELVKLNIRVRLGDTCAWVAPGLERQQVAAAGAPKSNTTAKLSILKLVTKMSVPVTAKEKTNKKKDVKARLQKIVSWLAIFGVVIAQEDLNSKFLNNLPPKWNTHVSIHEDDLESNGFDRGMALSAKYTAKSVLSEDMQENFH